MRLLRRDVQRSRLTLVPSRQYARQTLPARRGLQGSRSEKPLQSKASGDGKATPLADSQAKVEGLAQDLTASVDRDRRVDR